MIVDASAMLAILLNEADARTFANAIAAADSPRMPAPNWLEVVMKLEGMSAGDDAGYAAANRTLLEYTDNGILTIVPFTAEHTFHARQAFRQYGKGRHRAGLNFGDCIAYAVARLDDAALLFKGDDFIHTDIRSALKD